MFLDQDARSVLLMGINKVSDFVSRTMGPGGKTINIKRGGNNHITKDGVTVAKHFVVQDPAEQVGVDLIIEAAKKTLVEAGDGTTTTTVMARTMMLDGHQRLSLKRLNTNRIIKEMINFSEIAIEAITKQSIVASLDTEAGAKLLFQVGTISANGDIAMAKMCIEAIKAVGAEPTNITFTEAEFDEVDSMKLNTGMFIPSRVGGEILGPFTRRTLKRLGDIGRVAVLIIPSLDQEVSLTRELHDLMKVVSKQGHGCLVVCKQPATNLKTQIINDTDRHQVAYISPSLHGNKYIQLCEDLITLTGASLINGDRDETNPLPNIYLGYTETVEITKDNMSLVNPDRDGSEEHQKLIVAVEKMIKEDTNKVARQMLKERLARLSTGVATIRVTGDSGHDMIERIDRYDDCVRAICTSIKSGVVRGGGAAYLSAAYQLMEQEVDPLDQERKIARDLIEAALVTPYNVITMNAMNYIPKINGRQLVKETNLTIDVWTGEFIDAIENGILDPLGVQTAAIRSAVKVTSVFLNTGGMYQGRNEFM